MNNMQKVLFIVKSVSLSPLCLCIERYILLGRVERGNLIIDGASLIVEFSQQDATIPAMTEKVRTELRSETDIVLCDGQGNKLVESSGTTGMLCKQS